MSDRTPLDNDDNHPVASGDLTLTKRHPPRLGCIVLFVVLGGFKVLDKSIKHGKEHRKPYRKSKRFDRSCRNHGACPYCEANRTAKERAKEQAAHEAIREHCED